MSAFSCLVRPTLTHQARTCITRHSKAAVPTGLLLPRLAHNATTSKQRGDALEERVVRILQRLGYWHIRRNVHLRTRHGHLCEIDIVYGWPFRRFIECKNYSDSVPLEMVAKFKEVCALTGQPLRRALLVSSGKVSARGHVIGVPICDGDALRRWEAHALVVERRRRAMTAVAGVVVAAVAGVAAWPLVREAALQAGVHAHAVQAMDTTHGVASDAARAVVEWLATMMRGL